MSVRYYFAHVKKVKKKKKKETFIKYESEEDKE